MSERKRERERERERERTRKDSRKGVLSAKSYKEEKIEKKKIKGETHVRAVGKDLELNNKPGRENKAHERRARAATHSQTSALLNLSSVKYHIEYINYLVD